METKFLDKSFLFTSLFPEVRILFNKRTGLHRLFYPKSWTNEQVKNLLQVCSTNLKRYSVLPEHSSKTDIVRSF